MMRKLTAELGLALITILLLSSATPVQCAKGRAVSLRVLEKTLKDGSSKQALKLCGITRLSGFFVDSDSKDIILVGKVDPSYPSLWVDDLVVALRYANMMYARRQGNMRYYTPPGCSIDPDPNVIQQLQQVGYRRGNSEEDCKALSDDWEAIGRQPQKVRVMGVPFDTHFAKVMVDADYYMKRLSNGSVDLNIPGFTSLTSMSIAATKKEFASNSDSAEPKHSLNRFWFCPGEITYEERDGMILLKECQVKLLTEEEFLTDCGEVKGYGRPSSSGRLFAEGFTSKYQAIAEARPIYKELESLFRFAAIASLMRDEKAASRSGNQMPYLLSGYKLQCIPVSRKVTGQTRVVELSNKKETSNETIVRSVYLMSCGGVSMDVHPKKVAPSVNRSSSKPLFLSPSGEIKTASKNNSSSKEPDIVADFGDKAVKPVVRRPISKPRMNMKKTVLAKRKSKSALYWDVPDID